MSQVPGTSEEVEMKPEQVDEAMEDDDDEEGPCLGKDSSDSEDNDEEDDIVEDDEDVVENKEKEAVAYLPGQALEDGEELVMDDQAYLVYHQASLGPPCLSFDLIPDDLGSDRSEYPLTLYGVAGTQASKTNANCITVFKMHNLHAIKRKRTKDDDDDDDEDDEEEESLNDPEKEPKLRVASLRHSGCVNRIRFKNLGSTSLAAAWSETGSVSIWSLDGLLQGIEQPETKSSSGKGRESTSPLFSFRGHQCEGYALNWSPTQHGVLATGDCKKNIHIWKPSNDSWTIDQRPLVGHTKSVEDILWSPNEASVLATCSVDKSIRIWDCRAKPDKACMLTVENAHSSDVNVIDWNRTEPFLASGGDDGQLKIWDLRTFEKGQPVAVFRHHAAPVTSVEWHPTDSTVLASSGEDNQIALWDLAIEKDTEEQQQKSTGGKELKEVPPQLLFIHQGLQDVKELHWHPQIPGLITSTSLTGFDVFRTISV